MLGFMPRLAASRLLLLRVGSLQHLFGSCQPPFPSSLFILDRVHHPLGSGAQSCHGRSGFTHGYCDSEQREMKAVSVPFTRGGAGGSSPDFLRVAIVSPSLPA